MTDHEIEIQQTFTDDQRLRLAEALNLNSEIQIDGAVRMIVATVLSHHLLIAARDQKPDRVKSKRKLKQIADAARKLSALLAEFDVSQSIGNEIEEGIFMPSHLAKLFHRRPLWSDEKVSILDMFRMLRNIDINATGMAINDKYFSFYYLLTTMQEANREFNANILWPCLFKIWEMAGNKVAATKDGPTFRFLCLIHEIADIAQPHPGSLRSACERWRTDPLRSRHEKMPWPV